MLRLSGSDSAAGGYVAAYLKHFGLARPAFGGLADGGSYYPATSQQIAEKQLAQALAAPWCWAIVAAETGLGKTVLSHRLLRHVPDNKNVVWITNTHFPNQAAVLQSILFDLEMPYQQTGEHELRLALTARLCEDVQAGRQTLLLID